MKIFKEKHLLKKSEKKLLNKLKSPYSYILLKKIIKYSFSPLKKFLIIGGKNLKNTIGIISITTFNIFGKKIGYIDDFIINKKSRGKGIGEKLMNKLLEKSKKEKFAYVTLTSKSDRKISHELYKKIGFVVINLGISIIAYKKLNK